MTWLCWFGLHKWMLYSRNRHRYCLRCKRDQHRLFFGNEETWKDAR